jgi:uncharacterized cysteine cluster protein YcgN (CxxCxxCC family)
MNGYRDIKRVKCNGTESAGRDMCGKGIVKAQKLQQKAIVDQQRLWELLDKLCDKCVACCMLADAGTDNIPHTRA